MNGKKYINSHFENIEGGLFSNVTKADVGEGTSLLLAKGYNLLGWADPFFPDPSMPDSVMKAMSDALLEGKVSHYTMPIGSLELRTKIAEKCALYNHINVNPSRNVLVTPGSDSGLLYSMMPFLEDGDEVLIPDPSYPSNFLNCKLCGAVPVSVPLYAQNNYQFMAEEFEKRITPKTKMVLITHPNNPTGTVFNRKSLEELCRVIIKNDLILVCDQAFEDHIFDDKEFITPASLPGMWERTVTTFSISKGLGLSGLRVGYIVACDAFMDVLYGAAVNVLGATNTLAQIGAIAAMNDKTILPLYHKKLEQRRRMAFEIFSKIPKVKMIMPESGILSWLDISKIGTDSEVASYLKKNVHVLVNEGSSYGKQGCGHIRIVHACYKDDVKAKAIFENIAYALREMGEINNE